MVDNHIVDLLDKRVTTRNFSDKEVEPNKVNCLLEALVRVPSKQNRLPVKVHVLGPEASKIKNYLFDNSRCLPDFPDVYNPQLLAPYVFILSSRRNFYGVTEPESEQATVVARDAVLKSAHLSAQVGFLKGICAQTILLTAESLGLATGYCCTFPHDWLRTFEIGDELDANIALCVGYPKVGTVDRRDRYQPQSGTVMQEIPERRPASIEWIHLLGCLGVDQPSSWQSHGSQYSTTEIKESALDE
jgi:nitroreductase